MMMNRIGSSLKNFAVPVGCTMGLLVTLGQPAPAVGGGPLCRPPEAPEEPEAVAERLVDPSQRTAAQEEGTDAVEEDVEQVGHQAGTESGDECDHHQGFLLGRRKEGLDSFVEVLV